MQTKITCPFLTQQNKIHHWLKPWLTDKFTQLSPVAGDASFRRYYRLAADDNTQKTDLILMYAPPAQEDLAKFIRLAKNWQAQGVKVPNIIAVNEQLGVALLEDFGNQQLMQEVENLKPKAADKYYHAALDGVLHLQQTNPKDLPSYTEQLLQDEINLFTEWFLPLIGVPLTSLPAQWSAFTQQLVDSALNQPQLPVHRDYHSRNLMLLAKEEAASAPAVAEKDEKATEADKSKEAASETTQEQKIPRLDLGILDFQDAVIGPCTYDVVSLIKDCYLDWPRKRQLAWFDYYYQGLVKEFSASQQLLSKKELERSFQLMGMQRHLKVLGIFARLYQRDTKPNYLADLPLTLKHLIQASRRYPEYTWLASWLQQQIKPRLERVLPQLLLKERLMQQQPDLSTKQLPKKAATVRKAKVLKHYLSQTKALAEAINLAAAQPIEKSSNTNDA